MESDTSFYLTLPSNSCAATYAANKQQSYRDQLPRSILLDGKWEVALTEIQYPHNWINIDEKAEILFAVARADDKGQMKTGSTFTELVRIAKTSIPSADMIEVKLESGYYANAEDILERIVTTAHQKIIDMKLTGYPEDLLSFKINKNTQKCTIESKKPTIMICEKGRQYITSLGFFSEAVEGSYKPEYGLPVKSAFPFSVHQPTLYVYCDIVRHQFVGNKMAPILRIVPTSGKLGDTVVVRFERPYFVPICKGYINSVEIQINNDSGDLIKFISGKVVCVLHLRKVFQ